MTFSEEERTRAFAQIDEACDCNEVVTRGDHAYNPRIIDMQCRLNRAEELLRDLEKARRKHLKGGSNETLAFEASIVAINAELFLAD